MRVARKYSRVYSWEKLVSTLLADPSYSFPRVPESPSLDFETTSTCRKYLYLLVLLYIDDISYKNILFSIDNANFIVYNEIFAVQNGLFYFMIT